MPASTTDSQTPNFDRGLKLAMLACYLASVAAFFVGVAIHEGGGIGSQMFTAFIAGTLFTVGTYVGLALVVAPLFLGSWFRRAGDPGWVAFALPIFAFASTFSMVFALIWLFS